MMEPKTRRVSGPQLPANKLTLSLGGQIRDFAKLVGRRIDYVHRSIGMQLFTAIVYDTPVAEGIARGGWYTGVGFPAMGGPLRADPTGQKVIAEMQKIIMSAHYDDVLFFTNNVEYIIPLEYGWSRQSPEGMVRINVARMESIVKESVAEARNIK